jgi:hypothetical protein
MGSSIMYFSRKNVPDFDEFSNNCHITSSLAHAFRIPLAIISHLLNHADSKDAFMTI